MNHAGDNGATQRCTGGASQRGKRGLGAAGGEFKNLRENCLFVFNGRVPQRILFLPLMSFIFNLEFPL